MPLVDAILLFLFSIAMGQDLFLSNKLVDRPAKPNIIWFLTDDQDQMLGGAFPPTSGSTPMPKTKKLMQDEGALATNWYIHTPICSPSRSELLTGRYFHNIKTVGEAGGKYVNEMEYDFTASWDAFMANGGGDYIAPAFQTKNVDGLPDGKVQFTNDPSNYTTAVVGNMSIAWIKKVAKQGKPFFAYIAPKAAHEPFNPAVWYKDHWDPSWPENEPRGDNWNCSLESRKNHHGNIATQPMITAEASRIITGVFKNRWRTLMSVDDVIGDVIALIEELGLSDSTYFFYSQDHGFQLGQFNIPMDKRHVYEWDTKIHLLARGPGIKQGSRMSMPGTQVDIAPTFLGLAGVQKPPMMDGHSIVPFLVGSVDEQWRLSESTRQHLADLGDVGIYSAAWRKEVFIEYYYCQYNVKCTDRCPTGDYPNRDANCANLSDNADCWCTNDNRIHDPTCYATEDKSNNFIALRELTNGHNTIYAEFQSGDLTTGNVQFDLVDFVEHYDVSQDIWQMHNLAHSLPEARRASLHERLHKWYRCSGSSCP